MVLIVWQLEVNLLVYSVPVTTKVVSSNPVEGEVFSIQHYVKSYSVTCQWLCQRFSPGTPVSPHQYNWPPWYNWNIVENGIKHHGPPQNNGSDIVFFSLVTGKRVWQIATVFNSYIIATKTGDFIELSIDTRKCNEFQCWF
jgi:hypothetical protein